VPYQSHAARLNYYDQDRPELLHAIEELMCRMSSPTAADDVRLKRVPRFLRGAPRMVTRYPWGLGEMAVEHIVYADSDVVGCPRTRKSTSGGAATWDGCLIKPWSKTQPVVALSIGEAELVAFTRGSAEALGLRSVLADFGIHVSLVVESYATAAIGMTKRYGLGRVRHLAVADLWMQQKVRDRGGVVPCTGRAAAASRRT
jgi:hypothetical protein